MKNVTRSSSFIDKIETSLRKGEATVYLKDGNIYTYSNVSRRAIINLSVNENLSLGFWFNTNCAKSDRAILVNQSWETPWLDEEELDEYLEPTDAELSASFGTRWHDGCHFNQEELDELNEEYATANAW